MPHTPKTQFVIADGARARWVVRREHDFATTSELEAGDKAKRHPQGVVFEGSHGQRFNVEARDDVQHRDKTRFAEDIAAAINAQAADGAFDRLVVVAPARMMSAITERLSATARTKFVGSLAKDLTKTPDHELGTWLRSLELR